jgi:zinc/manganese transport system ATP-binding protein
VSAIKLKDLTISLSGRQILTRVSLEIEAGEFIGVLGPNGAGKTTLMRAILGLVPIANGEIRVLGKPVARGNPAIGYLPQVRSTGQQLRLTGWEFVAGVTDGHRLGLPFLGMRARGEVARALDLVGASDLARYPLSEISGGERQRLLLAQALIGRPKLLMLDEPLANLDPHYQAEVVALTKALQDELGMTILFTAHELNPLLGALDRVLYLGSGQAALGTVDEVITASVLSRLYGAEIDVVHVNGRIFVMAGRHDVEYEAHRHDPDDASTVSLVALPHDHA